MNATVIRVARLILFLFTERVSPDRTAQMRMMKCEYLKFMFGRYCVRR